MTQVVIDSSVAISFILRQTGVDDVDQRLSAWRRAESVIYLPSLFWLEVANVLIRANRIPAARVLFDAIHQFDELGLMTVEVDRPMVLLALDRAERFSLSVYDAAYLALAESTNSILYTSDRALLAAAGPRGLPVVDSPENRLSETLAPYGTKRRPTWPDYSGASAYLARLRAEATRTS